MKTGTGVAASILVLLSLAAEAGAAGLLVPRDGSPPIVVKSHRVTAEVSDGVARTTVRQTFVNPTGRSLEALYVFPLPPGAALTAVAMETDGRRLEGLLAERRRARRIYDRIVHSRRDPALVEQIGRELFRLSVFPVLPGKDTVVEITYVQRLPLVGGELHYVYPLATSEGEAVTQQDLTVEVTLRSSVPFTAVSAADPTVQIVRKEPGVAVATMEKTGAELDRDVVVTAKIEVGKPTLDVATWRGADGDGVFLATITPPAVREEQLVPRDVILVLDTSGSMHGEKVEQAKASALFLLDHLRAADRVNVIRFSSDVQPFADGPVAATAKNLEALREFVRSFDARGGTALGDALRQAVSVDGVDGRARTIVLLTDGRPTVGTKDPAEIVKIAKAGGGRGLRVFPFGVGADVDGGLLRGVAAAAGGSAELFRPGGEVETRLNSFLVRTSSPVLSGLAIAVDGLAVHDVFPRPLPDVYLGEQVAIVGRYAGGGEKGVTVSATYGGRRVKLSSDAFFRSGPGGPRAVADLYARTKLGWLEEQVPLRTGLSDEAYYAALDRGAYATADEIVEEMIAVSLEFSVQCPYTSFLVLLPEDRARIDPRDADAIAAALERVREARGDVPTTGESADAPADASPPANAGGASTSSSPFFFGGGAHRGPAGEVPPGQRDPRDPQPTPGNPGTPTDPGGSPGTPLPPAPVGPAGPAGGDGPRTGHGATARPMTFDHWLFWWAYNRDEILDTRARTLGATTPAPGTPRPDASPALLAAIANARLHPAIRGNAVLALARMGGPKARSRLLELARPESPEQLRGAAALGLSLLPPGDDPDIRAALVRLLDDASVDDAIRGAAAVALGLRRDRDPAAIAAIRRRVEDPSTSTDLRVAGLFALGLGGDPGLGPELAGWLERGKIGEVRIGDLETAWIVHALGRIGDPAALKAVTGVLEGRELLARRAAAIALGPLGPAAGAERQAGLVARIARSMEAERDGMTRSYLTMALGRIGGAPGTTAEVRGLCVKILAHRFRDGDRVTDRPFAALALGLLGFEAGGVEKPADLRDRIAGLLRADLSSFRGEPLVLGAEAIALGLLRDDGEETVEGLLAILRDRAREPKLRGAAALALGLLGAEKAREPLLAVMAARADRDLWREAATALGLIGGKGTAAALLGVFDDPKASQAVLTSAATALGRAGGADETARLLKILEPTEVDGAYPDLSRSLAAAALGGIALGDADPVLSRLGRDLPYRSMTPLLDRLLTLR